MLIFSFLFKDSLKNIIFLYFLKAFWRMLFFNFLFKDILKNVNFQFSFQRERPSWFLLRPQVSCWGQHCVGHCDLGEPFRILKIIIFSLKVSLVKSIRWTFHSEASSCKKKTLKKSFWKLSIPNTGGTA
jgi:hypothetical protein